MGGSLGRAFFDPYGVNTPLLGVSVMSLLFNTTLNGKFLSANMFSNMTLMLLLGVSNGCYGELESPLWGARIGLLGAVGFTVGAPLRILFTSRLFPRYVHYGIGGFYSSYHALQWYQEKHFFEDANEDAPDERF